VKRKGLDTGKYTIYVSNSPFFKNHRHLRIFDANYVWVILDLGELHKYIKKNKLTKVYVNDLISHLDWTIFLDKK